MKKTIFVMALATFMVGCNKKEETKVEDATASTENVTVDTTATTAATPDSATVAAAQNEMATEGDPVTVNMTGEGRNFQITYKTAVEGDPIAVLVENGKETILNQTEAWAKGAIYADKDKKIELTASDNDTVLKIDGKKIKLTEK